MAAASRGRKRGVKPGNKRVKKGSKRPGFFTVLLSVLLLALIALGIAYIPKIGTKLAYPRHFENEVLASSREYGLDPDLVFAVIRTESSFETNVVSRSGAMGLMQIMPGTAEWIASRRGFRYDSKKIYEPSYNIDLGCYLLSYLIDYYKNDLRLAVAAYNAGAGNVDKWLDGSAHGGETLEIPFPETRNYVQKVFESYEKYRQQHQ